MKKEFNNILSILETFVNFSNSYSDKKGFDYSFKKDKPFLDFNGFGSIAKFLLDSKSEEYKNIYATIYELEFLEYQENRVEEFIESMRRSVLTSYFTPESLIEDHVLSLKKIADKNNIKVNSILEPSAGNGRYIKYLTKHFPNATIYALEKDKTTAAILKYNFLQNPNVITTNRPLEKIDTLKKYPDKFDLIVSNIPFGSISVYDSTFNKKEDKLAKNIHNYFFLKALKLSHENTITSFITSKGFLDSKLGIDNRNYLAENSNFLGAVRLPNKIFKQAKTSVVTDVVYFQKGNNLDPINNKIPFSEVNHNYQDFATINQYFKEKENTNIIGSPIAGGMYNGNDYTIVSDKPLEFISNELLTISNNFNAQNYKISDLKENIKNVTEVPSEKIKTNTISKPVTPIAVPEQNIISNTKYPYLKVGNLFLNNENKVFKIQEIQNDNLKLKPLSLSKNTDFNRIASIIELRDYYNKLKLVKENNDDFKKTLSQFNDFYSQFNFQYQNLNDDLNTSILLFDSQNDEILNFEKFNQEKKYFEQSDVFSESFYFPEKKINLEVPKEINLEDAISLSLNKFNSINTDYITELLNVEKEDFIKQALDKKLIFVNPEFNVRNELSNWEYVTPDIFYSGKIHLKLDFYKRNDLDKINLYIFNRSYLNYTIEKLNEINPDIIPYEQLNAEMGEKWIPLKVVKDFIKEKYDILIDVKYSEQLDKYFVKTSDFNDYGSSNYQMIRERFNFKAGNGRYFSLDNYLDSALNSTIPTIKKTLYKDGEEIKVIDKNSVILFENHVKSVKNDFNYYILNNPKLKEDLELQYHHIYNSYVNPTYSSKHLKFKNLTFTPYDTQTDAAMKIIQNQGGIVDHKVGWGKTITAAMIALKMKELNLVKKSMFIALKSNIKDIEKNIKQAYPNIKILTAEGKSFDKRNINSFLEKIKQQDLDLVLITHDNFIKIPQNPDIQKEVINEEIDNIDRDLLALEYSHDEISVSIRKGIIKRKENLEVQLIRINDGLIKQKNIKYNFSELNIDHLLVDESHKFKNLSYTTRHNRVAGLNTASGSQRAFNLLNGIRTLQKKHNGDKGVTFLSGTTISNSITELYILFKYLRPNKLKQMQIKSFDQWVKVFGIKSLDVEKGMSGSYMMKERFREFKKVPELANFYTEISHVSHDSPHIKRPSLNNNFVILKPYPVQKAYFKDLEMFAANSDQNLLNDPNKEPYSERALKATALIAMNYMIKASLDMRIVNDLEYEDNPENRVRSVAKNLFKIYQESNSFKGTQLVFLDKSVPKKSFNMYDEIKRVLMEDYNIPSSDIAFIHDYENQKKRQKLFKDVNAGNVRILIGSTEKLGTGVNVQERGTAIHHVDIPYKPSEFEQRIGRFARQGNINETVQNYLYATAGSIDQKLYELNNIKNNFINQIKTNTLNTRTIDEGAIDVNGSISYRDFLIQISDNDDFAKIQQLGKEKDKLTTQKFIHQKQIHNNKYKIEQIKNHLNKSEKMLVKLKKDFVLFNTTFPDFSKDKEYVLDIKKYSFYENGDTIKSIADKFKKSFNQAMNNNKFTEDLFKYDNLNINIRGFSKKNYKIIVNTQNNISYSYGSEQLVQNEQTLINYPINAFKKINNLVKNYTKDIEQYQLKLEVAEGNNLNVNFTENDNKRLNDIDNELEVLQKKINADLDKKFEEDQNQNTDIKNEEQNNSHEKNKSDDKDNEQDNSQNKNHNQDNKKDNDKKKNDDDDDKKKKGKNRGPKL